MPQLEKAETGKIIALLVLLLIGVRIPVTHSWQQWTDAMRTQEAFAGYDDPSAVDSLNGVLEGHLTPLLFAHYLVTGQRDSIDLSIDGLFVMLPGGGCIGRQVEMLRRVQSVHEAIRGRGRKSTLHHENQGDCSHSRLLEGGKTPNRQNFLQLALAVPTLGAV